MKNYIVELKSNLWIALWGYTPILQVVQKFKTEKLAKKALKKIRQNGHSFKNAKIIPVDFLKENVERDIEREYRGKAKKK